MIAKNEENEIKKDIEERKKQGTMNQLSAPNNTFRRMTCKIEKPSVSPNGKKSIKVQALNYHRGSTLSKKSEADDSYKEEM